jgi:hypothetical protein
MQGGGLDPLLEGLFADLEQHSAAALALGAHDMHAPLVACFGAAAATVGDLRLLAMLVHVADEYPPVYTGTGAQALEA